MGVTTTQLLEIENLTVRFGDHVALNGLSLRIAPGESVGLVGESGSGKTMTGLAVLGLTPPEAEVTASRLAFKSRDLLGLDHGEMRRLRGGSIAWIPQDPLASLNPVLRVADQITEVERIHAYRGRRAVAAEVMRGYGIGARSKNTLERATELLDRVEITHPRARAEQYPYQFSGGMRQRAIIASALSADPSLVIADEPTTALDASVEFQVLRLLARLRTERGMAMLLITHDLNVASWNCDRIHVLYGGRSMEEGSTQKIFERPRHPYTAALLAATPSIDRPPKVRARSDTAPAGGSDGCPFTGRCPNVQAVCSERFPTRSEASEGHRFWCHNPLQ